MRLHTLELTGFGPFRETQRVDFDAFADDGVFLITGRTGAGKSSILDGVSFALYGTVPRYEGADKRLRSDHCALTDPTEVRLEFTIGDARWRVTRSPDYERPAKRGGGLTTEIARAELDELVGGVWVGRAARPRDVGLALGELLGLGAQQFQQVILLAQNKFSRFLLAPGDERQTLLRALFGTRRFEQYRDELDRRRRETQKRLDAAGGHARTLIGLADALVVEHALGPHPTDDDDPASDSPPIARPDDLSARRVALIDAMTRTDYLVEQTVTEQQLSDAAWRAAAASHTALEDRARRGRERAALRQRLDDLDARAPEIDADRARHDRARYAETLRAPIELLERADRAWQEAERAREAALAAWVASGGSPEADPAARIDELTADLARWADAAALERAQADLRGRIEAQAAEVTRFDEALAELATRLAAIPDERARLDAEIDRARAGAARVDDLRRRHVEVAAQCEAAREAAALAQTSDAAERRHLAASDDAALAAAAVAELLRRRWAGAAGELAEHLVDGEPCAVCGSLAHPHPAVRSGDPVTDDHLAAAEDRRDRTAVAAADAAEAARAARDLLSETRARSGDRELAAVEAALLLIRDELETAESDARALVRLAEQREALTALAESAARESATVAEQRAERSDALAAARADVARADAVISDARGSFRSVAERVADGEVSRALARTLVEAVHTAAERQRSQRSARADLDTRLASSGFETVDAARAALLPASERDELDARLTAHAAELRATRERLLELELDLADAGEEATDAGVAASAETVEAADARRTAAIAAARDANLTAHRLRELVQQIDDAMADVDGVAAEAAVVGRLADTVSGRAPNTMKMDLETFVLAAELEEIVAAANLRLSEMSAGRYTLHHSDARASRGRASGLGIDVLDAHTGKLRAPHSLSGGETFLASLALALGLGEVVTSRAGGIRLDTLFVDEGFGSLDPETLELAMRTLDDLRAGGRTVGVISHVEAMKEQLPAQLLVEATGEGPSRIRQDGVEAA
ncbi:AAA family ATPase [Microbacterium dextranolyticum]|uniref:Nuclease SbcCD subunit C n=1 Tax=Microbacterium dextranolyticum TaxID=36806 RepID=A0A9W6HKQ9_9MICO|nr:SMC family ATPase [Microbacterium dextranolyticum]MBM7463981.1 exonuclease SbcC [Microbacterium dextranolyticum]GLJ95060.1 nuclease SbcCD subunit C [Microbacterium dextranolyticum]